MLNKKNIAIVGALIALPHVAFAEGNTAGQCVDIAVPKEAVKAHNGQWIQLTQEQWQFLRGVYVVNPQTPPGLPYGDKAALAEVDGNPGALVFFIDGNKACTPMLVPHELLAMMQDVATDKIGHEGAGL